MLLLFVVFADDIRVSQIMYGVLYAVSPELFPAKDRGTGNGLTATTTRIFGVLVSSSFSTLPLLFHPIPPHPTSSHPSLSHTTLITHHSAI